MLSRMNTTAMLTSALVESTAGTDLYPPIEPFFIGVENTTYRFWINQYNKMLQNLTLLLRTGMLVGPVNNNLTLVPTQYDTLRVWRNPYNNYDEEVIFSRASNQTANSLFERDVMKVFDDFTQQYSGDLNPHIKGVALGVFFSIITFVFMLGFLSVYYSKRAQAREVTRRIEAGEDFPELERPGCYESICGGTDLMTRLMLAEMHQNLAKEVEDERIIIRP